MNLSSRPKSPHLPFLSSVAELVASTSLLTAAEDVVFEDFEGADYGLWTTEGNAFGAGPVLLPHN